MPRRYQPSDSSGIRRRHFEIANNSLHEVAGGERFPQDRELRRTGEMLGHPRDDVLRDDGHLPLALNFRCHVSVFLAEDGRRLHRHTPCVDGIRFDVPHPLKLSRRPNSSRLLPPISRYLRRPSR